MLALSEGHTEIKRLKELGGSHTLMTGPIPKPTEILPDLQ